MGFLVFLGALKTYLKITSKRCHCAVVKPGKTDQIAGASTRPGFYIAKDLASIGARITTADRSNAETVRDKITERTENPSVVAKSLDLYSLDSVRTFTEEFKQSQQGLDLLIHHDHISGHASQRTKYGLMELMQNNLLSPFRLTYSLAGLPIFQNGIQIQIREFQYRNFEEYLRLMSRQSGGDRRGGFSSKAPKDIGSGTAPDVDPPRKTDDSDRRPKNSNRGVFSKLRRLIIGPNEEELKQMMEVTPAKERAAPKVAQSINQFKKVKKVPKVGAKHEEPNANTKIMEKREASKLARQKNSQNISKLAERLNAMETEVKKSVRNVAIRKPKASKKPDRPKNISKITSKIEAIKAEADAAKIKMEWNILPPETQVKEPQRKPIEKYPDPKQQLNRQQPQNTNETLGPKSQRGNRSSTNLRTTQQTQQPRKSSTPNTQIVENKSNKARKPREDLQQIMNYKGWASSESEPVPSGPRRKGLVPTRDPPRKKKTQISGRPSKHRGLKW